VFVVRLGKPLQILENQNKAQDLTKENPRNDENERQKRHEELGKEGTEELRKLFRGTEQKMTNDKKTSNLNADFLDCAIEKQLVK
jgi:hypothetical protein